MALKICFIGAGNLATQLSKSFVANEVIVSQIFSRTIKSAEELAVQIGVSFTNEIEEIDQSADVYFVALKDSALNEVLEQIDFKNKLLVHCAGSVPISALNMYSSNTGVFYPLQTFSKIRDIDFKGIPVFIEANNPENEQVLVKLANQISRGVSVLDSERRKTLHISAVFACNFVNHFYALADQLLNSKNIDFEVLRPLILETAEKVQKLKPKEAQTGPAVRFDENIISSHLKDLGNMENLNELYTLVSKSIFEFHKK